MEHDGSREFDSRTGKGSRVASWLFRTLLALLLSISLACSESDLQLAGDTDGRDETATGHVDEEDGADVDDGENLGAGDVVEITCTAGLLCEAEEARAFAFSVQAEVIERWEELGVRDRAEIMMKLVNEHLAIAGVPELRLDLRTSHDARGTLAFRSWEMILAEDLVAGDHITRDDAAGLVSTVWHEARHAEQLALVASLRAGDGLSPSEIAAEIRLPDAVIQAASAQALVPGSPEAEFARQVYDSFLGDGRAHRRAVHAEIDDARTAYDEAADAYEMDPTEENKARRDAARQRYNAAYDAYLELPEEADAHAVGELAAAGISHGSPGAAGTA